MPRDTSLVFPMGQTEPSNKYLISIMSQRIFIMLLLVLQLHKFLSGPSMWYTSVSQYVNHGHPAQAQVACSPQLLLILQINYKRVSLEVGARYLNLIRLKLLAWLYCKLYVTSVSSEGISRRVTIQI